MRSNDVRRQPCVLVGISSMPPPPAWLGRIRILSAASLSQLFSNKSSALLVQRAELRDAGGGATLLWKSSHVLVASGLVKDHIKIAMIVQLDG